MHGPALRILDANANRAREALRVLEDYARFALNHDVLSLALKELRHDLTGATKPYIAEAILHRDTPGDVGTDNKTAAESTRADLASVVIAAGKRLGEALRVIEEVLKTLAPSEAARVETVRYRFYDLEQKLARTLRPSTRFSDVRLYVLITESICRRPWLEAAEEAILGGADCLQLREKSLDGGEFLRRAQAFVSLCRRHDVISIINDRPDVALLSGADGVHVGQEDLPPAAVRTLLGPNKIIGVSTHHIDQAHKAVEDGADYLGVGPVFRSTTKSRDFLPGLDYARQVATSIAIPAVAIAGITEQNLDDVIATGIRAVAVTAAVVGCDDVRAAASRMKSRLQLVGQTFLSAGPGEAIPAPNLVGQTFLSAISSSPGPPVHKSRRRLPHWHLPGSTYFLTFRVLSGELAPDERSVVLAHVKAGHQRYYQLLAVVVMPDHVHLLLRPNDGVDLSRIEKGTKGASARQINSMRNANGRVWQDECWDRIIRDHDELEEKLDYMLNNPVKTGLAPSGWDYPWWWMDEGAFQ